MERFLYLVKRKISGQVSAGEQEELELLLTTDEKLKDIHSLLFMQTSTDPTPGFEEAEQAYLKHLARMKRPNRLKQ